MCQDKRVHRIGLNSRIGKNSFLRTSSSSLIDYPWNPNSSQRIQHIPFSFDPINILPLCQQTELLFAMFIEGKSKYAHGKDENEDKANRILMENIQYHMLCVHDHELDMNREESDRFTLHILKRHQNKSPNFCPISENFERGKCYMIIFIIYKTYFILGTSSTDSQWRCFIKGISVTHVILTFVPASLQDLKSLVSSESPSLVNFNEPTETSERTPSRNSNYSDVPINANSALPLPIYVFDCPLSLLVDAYVNNIDSAKASKDVYEDHRYKMENLAQEEIVRLKSDDVSSVSPEPKSEESENSDSKSSTKQHCKSLALLYSKCFTMSLFSALHQDLFVHCADVQAAMDLCEENVYEIDITSYILVSFQCFCLWSTYKIFQKVLLT